MVELLKVDFKRVYKDKLILVMGILAVVFALLIPLLYAALLSSDEVAGNPLFSFQMYGKNIFFTSFSMSNNLGLIAPVLLSIILCKDFSFGTVRNKIIAGKSRTKIFMSMFIVSTVTIIAVMLFQGFLTLGTSLLFFDYQPTPFEFSDLFYFFASLGLEIVVLCFTGAMIAWLVATMKNVGLVIVLCVAISFGLSLIYSVIATILSYLEMSGGDETTIEILRFISRINVAGMFSEIGSKEYSLSDILYILIPSLIGIFGFVGLGLLKFNKKDLK